MLSFKVACNTPGNMVAVIAGSGGLWGYMGGRNRTRCGSKLPEECECCISIWDKNYVQEDKYEKKRKKAWTEKSAIQKIDFIHKIKHAFDYLFRIKIDLLRDK